MSLISFSLTKKKPVVKFPEGSSGFFYTALAPRWGPREIPAPRTDEPKRLLLWATEAQTQGAVQWLTSDQPDVSKALIERHDHAPPRSTPA
jgi:hypothetical protein